MNLTITGTIGLIFGLIAVLIGAYAVSYHSLTMAGGYILIAGVSGLLITRLFCTACPIKDHCVHLIPGLIARLWKGRDGPYSRIILLSTALLFAVILVPPQGVLISFPALLLCFWICTGIAALNSHLFLCPGCGNRFCPFRREKK